MKITSVGIKDDFWKARYGKYGKDFADGVPALSVPFAIHNPPKGAKSYAAILTDNDSIEAVGHPWTHWLVADLGYENIAENESRANHPFVQGQNSWGTNYYGGMAPHNAPHKYNLHIYALDSKLNLQNGFNVEQLHTAMKGHILERDTISAMYPN